MNTTSVHQLFFIRKTTSSQSVYLRITIDGVRLDISMNRSCHSDDWDSNLGRVKTKTEEAKVLNAFLDAKELQVNELHREFILRGTRLTVASFRAKYFGEDEEQQHMLLDVYREHNQEFESLVKKGLFAEGTLKRFQVCIKSMETFLLWKKKKKDIDIRDLNYKFIADYELYLKVQQGCSHNTAMGYLKKLKKISRLCVAREWLVRDPFYIFKITTEEKNRIILLAHEIEILKNHDFALERLRIVRDIFLFSCYTGLAYSDIRSLLPTNIAIGVDGLKWIKKTRQKTGTPIHLPLLPFAREIIMKYEDYYSPEIKWRLLPIFSNQKMNQYLKELTGLCGIDKNLTFHCARHTFATTVCLSNGVPIETVSKMLAHRSIRTTQLYAKVLDTKTSADMANLCRQLEAGSMSIARLN